MLLIGHIAANSVLLLVVLLFCLYFAVFEVGFRVGRLLGRRDAVQTESAAVVLGGMLTLFSFVLGLSLSIAMTRAAERRQAIFNEAATISTALLQTQAVADPRAAEIGRGLAEYQRLRRDFVAAPPDPAVVDELNRRTAEIQGKRGLGALAAFA